MITPLATPLDVTNYGSYSRAGIACSCARRLSVWLRVANAKKLRTDERQTALLSLLRLTFDQALCHRWTFAARRLEFLAARIVVRNEEMFNFVY
jgi:hypothetical protein